MMNDEWGDECAKITKLPPEFANQRCANSSFIIYHSSFKQGGYEQNYYYQKGRPVGAKIISVGGKDGKIEQVFSGGEKGICHQQANHKKWNKPRRNGAGSRKRRIGAGFYT